MNTDIIIGMVSPYLKDSQITYNEFEKIFSMLSLHEQYQVLDMLALNEIEVVPDDNDDLNFDIDLLSDEDNDFEILYDDSIFNLDNSEKEGLPANKKQEPEDDLPHIGKVNMDNNMICRLIQEGNYHLKQQLCLKNRGLVEKNASKYIRAYGHDLDFEDLTQAGYLGLIKAAERFDTTRGNEFSTYATWWIVQSITREIMDKGFTIRIPVHMFERINKVIKVEQIAESEGWDKHKFYIEAAERASVSVNAIIDCLKLRNQYINNTSLNTIIGEEDDTELQEMLPAEAKSVEDEVIEKLEADFFIEVANNVLTNREIVVIKKRYGLETGSPMTLEEIGTELNLTRERIRQIQEKALRKMRRRLFRIGY